MKKLLVSVIVSILFLGTMGLSQDVFAQTFSTPINISNQGNNLAGPRLAIDDTGIVYGMWCKFSAPIEILLVKSTDGGATFSLPAQVLFNGNPLSCLDDIDIEIDDSGNIYILIGQAVYKSSDGGASVSLVGNVLGVSLNNQEIAVSGTGNVFLTGDASTGITQVFFSSSIGVNPFSAPVPVAITGTGSEFPDIGIDEMQNIHVTWKEGTCPNCHIFYSRSTDGGTTFSVPLQISVTALGGNESPQISVDRAGNVNIVWDKNESTPFPQFQKAQFSRSQDGGLTFSAPAPIESVSAPTFLNKPDVAADPFGLIATAWTGGTSLDGDVHFSSSNDGMSFSTPVPIDNTVAFTFSANIASGARGEIAVAWQQDTVPGTPLTFDVFFSTSGPLPVNTPVGNDVVVNLGNGVELTFESVTSEGLTSLTTSSVSQPTGFGISFLPTVYSIETTAVFTGNVSIKITYDDSSLAPGVEPTLQIFQFDATLTPIDITDGSIAPNPDTVANMIVGQTVGFSIFGLGVPTVLQPPIPVGGELIPLDSTMILVAGAQMNAAWMIPVIVSGIGIAIVIARKF